MQVIRINEWLFFLPFSIYQAKRRSTKATHAQKACDISFTTPDFVLDFGSLCPWKQ
jgi:hypothetical protein